MYLSGKVRAEDLFLFLEDHSCLVVGDVHLGFEESLAKQGVFIPKFLFQEACSKLEHALKELRPEKVVFGGDLKHEFGTISKDEWRDSFELLKLAKSFAEVVVVKGNHDVILEPVLKRQGVPLPEHYALGVNYFCHGHKVPRDEEFKRAARVFIGHEHPAVTLRDAGRVETYKCFLKGRFQGKEVFVLPSVPSIPEGSDVLRESLSSPFLQDLSDFEVFVTAGTVYRFGKVKDLLSTG